LDSNNSHVGDDDLESYSRRTLPAEAVARVELHLLTCETCRMRLTEAEEYMAAMRDAARGLPRQLRACQRQPWRFPRLIPLCRAGGTD
jgi:hypothetical protein